MGLKDIFSSGEKKKQSSENKGGHVNGKKIKKFGYLFFKPQNKNGQISFLTLGFVIRDTSLFSADGSTDLNQLSEALAEFNSKYPENKEKAENFFFGEVDDQNRIIGRYMYSSFEKDGAMYWGRADDPQLEKQGMAFPV